MFKSRCFSHAKSVFTHDTRTDCCTRIRYPPFTDCTAMLMGKVMGKAY